MSAAATGSEQTTNAQNQTEHLLLFSIGPIQDFIASARRCQDLWYGSWLLSELSRTAANAVSVACGGDALIFPGSLDVGDEQKPAVANKILCVVPAGKSPAEIAAEGEAVLRKHLHSLAERLFDRIDDTESAFCRKTALEQVDDLIEVQWVAVALSSRGGYADARSRAESALAACKNTKVWKQVTWGKPVPKSSLDGERESVLDEKLFGARPVLPPEQLRVRYHVKKSERLCGVGLLKRIGSEIDDEGFEQRPSFHSTSHVASLPFLIRLARCGGAGDAVGRYLDALRGAGVSLDRLKVARRQRPASPLSWSWREGEAPEERTLHPALVHDSSFYDGYLFYPSRVVDLLEQYSKSYAGAKKEEQSRSQRSVEEALAKLRSKVGCLPSAYYAVLLADGDNMGKAIDTLANLDSHRALGKALDEFSTGCRDIVEKHAGSLIYAGGDDVLALLPLHTALQCARALAEAFEAKLAAVDGVKQLEARPTLSVGLGIAHHLDDMADARALAKRAEKAAKEFESRDGLPSKNALAIAVSPRSGPELQVVGSWAEERALDRRLLEWVCRYHAEEIPDKAAFELEEAIAPLALAAPAPGTPLAQDRAQLAAATEAQVKRVLKRRRAERGAREMTPGHLGENPLAGRGDDKIEAALALSRELQVARVFLEAFEVAWGKVKA